MTATLDISKTAALTIIDRYNAHELVIDAGAESNTALLTLDDLVTNKHFEYAVEFLAYWLSDEERIWWGCLGAWEIIEEAERVKYDDAFCMILQWLQSPTEANRQSLRAVYEAHPPTDIVGLIAKAAYLTSGSMTEPHLPTTPPPKHISARVIKSVIRLIETHMPSGERDANFKQLLRYGMEILQGINRWTV